MFVCDVCMYYVCMYVYVFGNNVYSGRISKEYDLCMCMYVY